MNFSVIFSATNGETGVMFQDENANIARESSLGGGIRQVDHNEGEETIPSSTHG